MATTGERTYDPRKAYPFDSRWEAVVFRDEHFPDGGWEPVTLAESL